VPTVGCSYGYCSGGSASAVFSRPTPVSQSGPYENLDIGIKVTEGDSVPLANLDFNPTAGGVNKVNAPYIDSTTTGVTGTTAVIVDTCSSTGNCTAKLIGEKSKQRMGRLMLENVYGSELLDIRVAVRAQYWNGNSWITHVDDNRTSLPAASFALGHYIAPPASMTGTAVSSANMGSTHLPSGNLTLSKGVNTLILTKPNPAAIGSFDIVANLNGGVTNNYSCEPASADTSYVSGTSPAGLPWLLGNWCGSNFDRAPSARVKLGASKAPFIYLRERY